MIAINHRATELANLVVFCRAVLLAYRSRRRSDYRSIEAVLDRRHGRGSNTVVGRQAACDYLVDTPVVEENCQVALIRWR